jgi:hypothetical protein
VDTGRKRWVAGFADARVDADPASSLRSVELIVTVSSPHDHDITSGNLCIKGRFGFQHVRPKQR